MSTDTAKIAAKIVSLAGGTAPTSRYVADVKRACARLALFSSVLDSLNEKDCCEPASVSRNATRATTEKKIADIVASLYPSVVRFETQRDPRGSAVLLFLRDGSSNCADCESWRFDM
jgi:hypothetical protein